MAKWVFNKNFDNRCLRCRRKVISTSRQDPLLGWPNLTMYHMIEMLAVFDGCFTAVRKRRLLELLERLQVPDSEPVTSYAVKSRQMKIFEQMFDNFSTFVGEPDMRQLRALAYEFWINTGFLETEPLPTLPPPFVVPGDRPQPLIRQWLAAQETRRKMLMLDLILTSIAATLLFVSLLGRSVDNGVGLSRVLAIVSASMYFFRVRVSAVQSPVRRMFHGCLLIWPWMIGSLFTFPPAVQICHVAVAGWFHVITFTPLYQWVTRNTRTSRQWLVVLGPLIMTSMCLMFDLGVFGAAPKLFHILIRVVLEWRI